MAILPIKPIDGTVELSIVIHDCWNSNNVSIDLGYNNDKYSSSCTFLSDNNEPILVRESNTPSRLDSNGFYPFGDIFDGGILGYTYPVYVGRANERGDYHKWSVSFIPNDTFNFYTTTWVVGAYTGFSLCNSGIQNVPIPVFTPIEEYNISANRSGSFVREYDRGSNVVNRKSTVTWNDLTADQFRFLFIYILRDLRNNVCLMDFYDTTKRLAPWHVAFGETGTQIQVKLSSNEVSFSCNSGDLWSITIEVIKWQE